MFAAVVMTKPKEKDGYTKYQVYRRVSDDLPVVQDADLTYLRSPFRWIS